MSDTDKWPLDVTSPGPSQRPGSTGSNMNDEPAETIVPPPPNLLLDGEADAWEANLNMREWVRKALEEQGAECTGSGFGACMSDLDIELEGMRYNIQIRPRGCVLQKK